MSSGAYDPNDYVKNVNKRRKSKTLELFPLDHQNAGSNVLKLKFQSLSGSLDNLNLLKKKTS